ncbi:MAG TPA: excinuclease ABC subunit UvrA [Candidatus Xenobia bacterium]|nr:excinuclease ABC subunit UvrA [Candidatus Xenobia bacterium]
MATKVAPASKEAVIGTREALVVRGARVHNLKNITVEIPHSAITVITGVSGSGKSSLAFDTIYAEGQRRYVESLSAYARQFLERIEKPEVDEIEGIAPAIAIKQKNTGRNPRSTVATATELYDYLRLLFARVGETWCANCGIRVEHDTIDQIAARVLALPAGSRFYVLFRVSLPAPEGKRKKGVTAEALKAALTTLRQRGFNRLYQRGAKGAAGKLFEFSTPESLLDLDLSEPVYVLVDRLAVPAAGEDSAGFRSRLVDSVELSYREGDGEVFLELVAATTGENWLRFTERFECRRCGAVYAPPEPALFSFNSPHGACPRCHGFGNTIDFDLDKVIPDKGRRLSDGAIDPWSKPRYRHLLGELRRFCRREGIDPDASWNELSARERKKILDGDEDFIGVKGFFAWLERKKYKLHVRVFLSRYRGYALCPECEGARLRKEARAVRLPLQAGEEAGRRLPDVVAMNIAEARQFFDALELTRTQLAIADKVLEEIRHRLRFLDEVGLGYLTLDRLTSTLAGGEAQRIQLATSIGQRLVGALYVLDEPSIGLHPRDTHRLIEILNSLRALGNTILVVEHDPEMIRAADHVLDLGPGAGEHGGRVVFSGPVERLAGDKDSLTGRYLSGELRVAVPATRRRPNREWLRFRGCAVHNLKNIDVEIPLGLTVGVTGVSGSGKSSLVHEVIYRTLAARATNPQALVNCSGVEGAERVQSVVLVDQSPIGRTPRSNPVTYIKAFDAIRELLAATPEAKKRGYTPGHFSFNVPGGRCDTCQGDGTVTVEMQFLADVELVCEDCQGTRFKSGVLEVGYKGKNVHEILQLTVREALAFFAGAPKVVRRLKVLDDVGLGYLRLGQSATTLSGGEAQRVKLAAYLTGDEGPREGDTPPRVLYIFDEPTTGLHFDDIQKLLGAFRKLLEGGATVLIIEHNLEVIKTMDWIIDLGPEGGDEGGHIVVAGTPEQVAHASRSHTGRFLARVLNHNHRNRATTR